MARFHSLESILTELDSFIIAFSGGVDSGTLFYLSHQLLGPTRVHGVLIDSESLSRREFKDAIAFAEFWKLPLSVSKGTEMLATEYVANSQDRCYYCKSDMVSHLQTASTQLAMPKLVYGFNSDDKSDVRPGHRAAQEGGVESPLAMAQWDKKLIRKVAKSAGLTLWDKPASPCLASRIPHGTPVTNERLRLIERSEDTLKDLGFKNVRVRLFGETARLEIDKSEWQEHFGATDPVAILKTERWFSIVEMLWTKGFSAVEFNEKGLVSGGLNLPLHPASHHDSFMAAS